MNITFEHIDNVTPVKMLSATSVYGTGLLTSIVFGFCQIFGTECKMINKKVEKAKLSATNRLIEKAYAAKADGIMSVTFQVHGTQVFMYGIAYTTNSPTQNTPAAEAWVCEKCQTENPAWINTCQGCAKTR